MRKKRKWRWVINSKKSILGNSRDSILGTSRKRASLCHICMTERICPKLIRTLDEPCPISPERWTNLTELHPNNERTRPKFIRKHFPSGWMWGEICYRCSGPGPRQTSTRILLCRFAGCVHLVESKDKVMCLLCKPGWRLPVWSPNFVARQVRFPRGTSSELVFAGKRSNFPLNEFHN